MSTTINKLVAAATLLLLPIGVAAAQPLPPPSMEDLIHFKSALTRDGSTRVKALRQVGIAAGSQSGFARRAQEIIDHYCLLGEDSECPPDSIDRKRALDGMFMFRPLIDPRGFLPPVITEVDRSQNVSSNRMVISGRVYRIDRPARFVSHALTWRDYLLVGLSQADVEPLPDTLRPKSNIEKKEWTASIEAGWKMGVRRADDVFQVNLDRLKADYVGMLRYQRMRLLGLVDEPVISRDIQSVQTTQNSIVNSLETREIQVPATMNGNTERWHSELSVEHELHAQ